jgi:predicted CoA-binding protein
LVNVPESISRFLSGKRIVVAGVSRARSQAANAIYRKLRDSGYAAIPVNPRATEVEGVCCYPNLGSVPGAIDGVVVATPPAAAVEVIRQCGERGVRRAWFHRAFGEGSVSEAAVEECAALGVECIVGGCPLMYCEPVDVGHRCIRWWLAWRRRLPR